MAVAGAGGLGTREAGGLGRPGLSPGPWPLGVGPLLVSAESPLTGEGAEAQRASKLAFKSRSSVSLAQPLTCWPGHTEDRQALTTLYPVRGEGPGHHTPHGCPAPCPWLSGDLGQALGPGLGFLACEQSA